MSRILFVTNDFPTRRGGIETFVLALCQHLPPEEVVVYTASMPGDLEYDAELPFPVYRDPVSMLLPTPAVARRVIGVMRRHGCDRVVFGASAPLGLLAPRLRRAGARRMVALTHGHEVWWARVPVARHLLRRIGDTVDVMTYVSEWCRDRISPALSAEAAARMQRLSPGVDTDRFYPGCGGAEVRERLGIPADAPVIVCTARMVKRKGQDTLVKAWPQVLRARPDARLLLVGDGPYRQAVERLVERLGITESVIFTGSVPWTDIPAYTDAGDVYAMPCRTRLFGLEPEAFGIVLMEAEACGLPVLVGDSGGAPEAVPAAHCVTGDHAEWGQLLSASALSSTRLQSPSQQLPLAPAESWVTVARRIRAMTGHDTAGLESSIRTPQSSG
ncbi:MAG: glycosyltransferase family 4 protein [Nocardioides sp.]